MLDRLEKSFFVLLVGSIAGLYVSVVLRPTTVALQEVRHLTTLLNDTVSRPASVIAGYRQDWIAERSTGLLSSIRGVVGRQVAWARPEVASSVYSSLVTVTSAAAVADGFEVQTLSSIRSDLENESAFLAVAPVRATACASLDVSESDVVRITARRGSSSDGKVSFDVNLGPYSRDDGQKVAVLECDLVFETSRVAPLAAGRFGQAFPWIAAAPSSQKFGALRASVDQSRDEALASGAELQGVKIKARHMGGALWLLVFGIYVYQLAFLQFLTHSRDWTPHVKDGTWVCILPSWWAIVFASTGGLALPFGALVGSEFNLIGLDTTARVVAFGCLLALQATWFAALLRVRKQTIALA